jgi:hypothetical protein
MRVVLFGFENAKGPADHQFIANRLSAGPLIPVLPERLFASVQ